jgi:RNA polymerase sigma-70 factor (ECF subfamily)
MGPNLEQEDRVLVEQCISGSKRAWDELYRRFIPLVRKAVQRYTRYQGADIEDVIQNVFVALFKALKTYDGLHPLSKFIWIVAERCCVDEYRMAKAAKRKGETLSIDPVDHHDRDQQGSTVLKSLLDLQDQRLLKAEALQTLRLALKKLGKKCGELLRLRYLQELPFDQIEGLLGTHKKTLAVQAGRCLDELRERFAEIEKKGSRS